jgi:hypothetical protein
VTSPPNGIRRVVAAAAGWFFLTSALAAAARADITPRDVGHTRITLTGDRVEYFSDDGMVIARGHVAVQLPDGSRLNGDAFAMDLRQKRLLVAGHVRFLTGAGELDGAAMSDFLIFDRVYFLPLVPTADRWTFFNGDFSKPVKGRDMPGDAFAFPDLRGHRPYVSGQRATIDAGTYIEVEPATTAILMGPDTPPLPAFVDNYSSNPAFGQNALPGATFDAPYPFYGSPHTLEALHFRIDQVRPNPYFGSFEHHSVGDDGAFAVFSLNAFTQIRKQWTLLGYMPMGTRQALSMDAQLFTSQAGIAQPLTSNGFADVQYVTALRRSSVLADVTQSYDSLIPGVASPNHPTVAGIQWSGYSEPIFKSGFTYRLTSGLSWIHDTFGVSGQPLRDVGTRYAGAIVASPSFSGPFHTTAYASASMQRTWLTFPNQIATRSLFLSDGKELAPRLYGVLTALVQSVSTNDPTLSFASPNAASGLAPAPQSPNGLPVLQFPTTTPSATDRSYGLTVSWQPTAKFQFGATGLRSVYSPGQPFAPSSLSLNVRANVTRSIYVTLGRSYYFNWFGQSWSPRFTLQVSGQ